MTGEAALRSPPEVGVQPRAIADAVRRAELSRMRALATGLLALMTVLFAAARLLPARWGWPPFVVAFSEAAMVGACADWFAVTALFRRPFGLPIPHTAIIPRNKDRIGRALGDFIGGELLTPRLMDERLRDFSPADRLVAWLTAPGRAAALAARLAALAPDLAPTGETLKGLASDLAARLARGPAAPTLSRVLRYLWSDPAARRLLDRAIAGLADLVAAREADLRGQMSGRTWRWMPKVVDELIAERLAKGLVSAAGELRDPEHPWRRELEAAVERFLHDLDHDPELIAKVEAMKARLLTDPAVARQASALWAEITGRLSADPQLMEHLAERGVRALARWLAEDATARARLDLWLRIAARRALSPRRRAIGDFVSGVVASWDAREAVEKLELQVGRDLQYIRINGTLVGGLVGLAIYAVGRLTGR